MGLSEEQYRNLTAPPDESCQMYNQSYATWGEDEVNLYLSQGPPAAETVDCMDGMSYSQSIYTSTIVTEVCYIAFLAIYIRVSK